MKSDDISGSFMKFEEQFLENIEAYGKLIVDKSITETDEFEAYSVDYNNDGLFYTTKDKPKRMEEMLFFPKSLDSIDKIYQKMIVKMNLSLSNEFISDKKYLFKYLLRSLDTKPIFKNCALRTIYIAYMFEDISVKGFADHLKTNFIENKDEFINLSENPFYFESGCYEIDGYKFYRYDDNIKIDDIAFTVKKFVFPRIEVKLNLNYTSYSTTFGHINENEKIDLAFCEYIDITDVLKEYLYENKNNNEIEIAVNNSFKLNTDEYYIVW